jgi:hypothetical protein
MICHSWKVMFHAEYSLGQPLKMLADLRTVVEEALARSEKAKGASAGATTSGSTTSRTSTNATNPGSAPEFDISSGPGVDGDVF